MSHNPRFPWAAQVARWRSIAAKHDAKADDYRRKADELEAENLPSSTARKKASA